VSDLSANARMADLLSLDDLTRSTLRQNYLALIGAHWSHGKPVLPGLDQVAAAFKPFSELGRPTPHVDWIGTPCGVALHQELLRFIRPGTRYVLGERSKVPRSEPVFLHDVDEGLLDLGGRAFYLLLLGRPLLDGVGKFFQAIVSIEPGL